jgi:hypothetical protein
MTFVKNSTHFARDEATDSHADVLHVGHTEQGETRFDGSQDVHMTSEWVSSTLGLASGQLHLDLPLHLRVVFVHTHKSRVEQLTTQQVQILAHLQREET